MTRPLIPPDDRFISSRILFHPSMNAALKDTLIQMMALTLGNKANMTPMLTYPLLEQLTRKSARRLYGHFTVLRKTYSALELQSTGNGTFVLVLADWLFEPRRKGYGFKQKPVKEEELTQDESRQNLVLLDSSFNQEEGSGEKPRQIAKFGKRKPLRKVVRALSSGLSEKLLEAGVFPFLLEEVAASEYSEDDLAALLAWFSHDQPDNPAPMFMGRLRVESRPPKAYQQAPCPYCGKYGGEHEPECRGRYLSGDYAEFLEH